MSKIITAIFLAWIISWALPSRASEPAGVPFKISQREYNYLESLVCLAKANMPASKIKAYSFPASAGGDGKMALEARTSAYVECESHAQFNDKPIRYIDDCDLVDGKWDCSPPQLEVLVDINGREIKMRPWGLTPEKSFDVLKELSSRQIFQGESIDKAIGNSCDVSKTKDPEVVEFNCEAAMSISFWCPQIDITGCPRILYLSFSKPAYQRRRSL